MSAVLIFHVKHESFNIMLMTFIYLMILEVFHALNCKLVIDNI